MIKNIKEEVDKLFNGHITEQQLADYLETTDEFATACKYAHSRIMPHYKRNDMDGGEAWAQIEYAIHKLAHEKLPSNDAIKFVLLSK